MTIYAAGTPINEIRHFNRGIKVSFTCSIHGGNVWASKDPFVSSWFCMTSNVFGAPEYKDCGCKHPSLVTTEEYNDGEKPKHRRTETEETNELSEKNAIREHYWKCRAEDDWENANPLRNELMRRGESIHQAGKHRA